MLIKLQSPNTNLGKSGGKEEFTFNTFLVLDLTPY